MLFRKDHFMPGSLLDSKAKNEINYLADVGVLPVVSGVELSPTSSGNPNRWRPNSNDG